MNGGYTLESLSVKGGGFVFDFFVLKDWRKKAYFYERKVPLEAEYRV